MATHSSSLVWEISWTEEPGGLQSMGLKTVGHDLAIEQQLKKPEIPQKVVYVRCARLLRHCGHF